MKKYIIKNCPYYSEDETLDGYENMADCQNITNCLLKQIVEKCKLFQNNYLVNDGVQLLTTNILNNLDIQEVE